MFYIICFFLTLMAFNCYLANNILLYFVNKKYSKIKNESGVSGESFARSVLDDLYFKDVEVNFFKREVEVFLILKMILLI